MHELDHYIYPHRVLHWLVAGVVLLSLLTGLTLGFLGYEGTVNLVGNTLTNFLYTSHKTLGVALLLLMTLRIITRLAFLIPDHDPPLNRFERIASTSVHHLLYLALIVMPLLGWAATASGGFPVEFFHWHLPGLIGEHKALSEELFIWHERLGWAIVALLALHVTGALYHWQIKRDNVMKRMSLFD
ncbi:cytochrome b/b6 domain-containing protein [Halomonas sp. M1]|uniref:cytochrome b n=1 Tax=Halomonas sp. M1 TaxID=3035470 RepID=UPI0024867EBD|nr:cytochrome b/b6 domain-containing protein [Halomonas sp. M1]WFE72873.1 cytochrome b/b6 domain-containing protein [Halomonas sp. M1]